MNSIRTARLELVATTLAHLEADIESPESLGRLLGVEVPKSWPPGEYDRDAMEFFRQKLAESSDAVGWYGWYAIHRELECVPVLIGAGGYLGPPDDAGMVEIGYSISPEFHKRAFATELVEALVANAFSKVAVSRVIAHANATNAASIRVLERGGLTLVGAGAEAGTVRYEKARGPS